MPIIKNNTCQFHRRIISFGKLFLVLFLISPIYICAQPTPQTIELAKTIPIADVHMHTYSRGGPSSAAFLEQMDKNNVRWGGAVGDYRADVSDKLKERYIPAIGQIEFFEVYFNRGASGLTDEENWTFKRLYKNAEEHFANGTIKGFGELHTDNHSSGPHNIRRTIRADNPAMRRMCPFNF